MIAVFLLLFTCAGPADAEKCGYVQAAQFTSPMECAQAGMVIGAKWADEHPKERVASYRCVAVIIPQKDA